MMKKLKYFYHEVHDVDKRCNMSDFGAEKVSGFRPERGYGYFEFKEEEYLKLHKNVVLLHKVFKHYEAYALIFFIIPCMVACMHSQRTDLCILDLEPSSFVLESIALISLVNIKFHRLALTILSGLVYLFKATRLEEN
jgi:hypothetical protein